MRRARGGVTLVELVVVLVLLGIMAGVVGLTLETARPVAAVDPMTAAIAAARDSAIRGGRAVTMSIPSPAGPLNATAWPDGRVAADAPLGIDLLSGAGDGQR